MPGNQTMRHRAGALAVQYQPDTLSGWTAGSVVGPVNHSYVVEPLLKAGHGLRWAFLVGSPPYALAANVTHL